MGEINNMLRRLTILGLSKEIIELIERYLLSILTVRNDVAEMIVSRYENIFGISYTCHCFCSRKSEKILIKITIMYHKDALINCMHGMLRTIKDNCGGFFSNGISSVSHKFFCIKYHTWLAVFTEPEFSPGPEKFSGCLVELRTYLAVIDIIVCLSFIDLILIIVT